jgi:hypothetical protein
MENLELTIAVGAAILVYKSVRITVWQKDLDSPFSFEFVLDGRTIRRKTRTSQLVTWPATFAHALIRNFEHVANRERKRIIKNPPGKFAGGFSMPMRIAVWRPYPRHREISTDTLTLGYRPNRPRWAASRCRYASEMVRVRAAAEIWTFLPVRILCKLKL